MTHRYCATHQEMREAVVRRLDGPGISPLDVMPQTWAHCPGFKEEMEHRRRKVEAIKVRPLLDRVTLLVGRSQCKPKSHHLYSKMLGMARRRPNVMEMPGSSGGIRSRQ